MTTTPTTDRDEALRQRLALAVGAHRNGLASDGQGWFRDEADETECYTLAAALLPLVAAERADAVREEAAALRRTPRDSRDYPAALTGARIIEDRLRARAAAIHPQDGGRA